MSFRRVGDDLRGLLEQWLHNPESRRVVLERTWEQALGDKVSRRCRPVRFADGVLTVEVTDTSWAKQLQAMSADLIGKVNTTLGSSWVRRIEWVDGAGDSLPPLPRG